MVDQHVVDVVLESLRKYPPDKANQTNQESFSASDLEFQTVARLWAGMGFIYRVRLGRGQHGDDATATTRIVKHVRLPSSITSRGDQRKADSYQCEANFYQYVVPQLREKHAVPLPQTFYVERGDDGNSVLIVMSYIDTIGSSAYLNPSRTNLVLTWLARFHAATWGETSRQLVQTHGLQPIGTYWHLKTRPDEHASMSSRGFEGRLKKAAKAIHERLQRDPCQCLVHGDVKDANLLFCLLKNKQEGVVLCDFQYCGQGTPAQDLAYFFCSSVEALEEREEEYLAYYVEQLSQFLPPDAHVPSLEEMRESLYWSYADFQRFMFGWGMWGNDLTDRVQAKLCELDDGKNLGSENAYCLAMKKRFG